MALAEGVRPVVLVWLLLATLSTTLLVRAALDPPPGTAFVGTFYYTDDFYNYLGYVQQAEAGAFVFRNKLAPPSEPPALVNLEWLLVGRLSSLLGGRPLLAYRGFGLVALLGFVALVDRWLVRGGLPPARRLAALLLVFTGGGLGGPLLVLGRLPDGRAWDVTAGIFAFVETMANPHFVAGTTLLLAALGAFAAGRPLAAAGLGTVLGLVRPYDAALLAGAAGGAALLLSRPRDWPRALLPVAALVPVLTWNAWVFLVSPGFRVFSSPRYASATPGPLELALALGPAALLALTALRVGEAGDAARRHRLHLAVWAGLAVTIALLRPVSFSLQFLAGSGVPLLTLGAIGLGRLRRGVLEAAVPLFASTAAVVTWLLWSPIPPGRHVPVDRFRVAQALRSVCRPGELVLAPPDIGLYVGGLTACWPYVSHTASPEHEARDGASRRFYASSPEERARLLEELCVSHVVMPRHWSGGGLPPGAPYRRRLEVEGPGGGLAVLSRSEGSPCPDAPP